MNHAATIPDPSAADRYRGIGPVVVSARTLVEYRQMFRLTDGDLLSGPVLDVAAGASSFLADLTDLGGVGVAVDPLYDRPVEDLLAANADAAAKANGVIERYPHHYAEHVTADPEGYLAHWRENTRRFSAHYRPDSPEYRRAELPRLPFEDRTFALTLCSHFLFSYPDHVDHALLRTCLLELCRVTSGEVRVYPLVDTMGESHPGMDMLLAELAIEGITAAVDPVEYRLFRSGTHMLTLRHA